MPVAPTIYDAGTDALRPATQQDVDRLIAIERDYYDFRSELSAQLVFARSRVLEIEKRAQTRS